MSKEEKFLKYQRLAAKIKKERDKALGANEQILRRLKEEFGVSSIEEAEALLEKQKKKLKKQSANLEEMERRFEKEWKHELEELENDSDGGIGRL